MSRNHERALHRLVRAVVENQASKDAQKLSRSLHHILEALLVKKKHKKKEYHGGAVLWSPRKVREARVRQSVKEQEEKEQKLRKAEIAELRKAAKLYKEKIAEEKRVGREAAKKGKRKASQPPTQSNKRQKRVVDAVATKEALGAVLAAPPKTTRRGRNVKLLSKYK
ncbi:hypothetical protein BU23DRAFT_581706 [Bimuria novae-zelandiae CBS 107.79]|uniref:Uncharacterized protein n=1 Tax=Bimuria novae-zelandiae CBS 107.79 TaxID=1447943 RepID=A0A6A5V1Y7_9PLEO|nr:hypothetical protein BU23DRAFT_581706 [Bimuria novae-zelandiae CBS 107.79]